MCEEIKQSIEKVVQNPRIAVISPKLALGYATSENQEAEYETEVEKLVQFIHVDLIARKKQIQAENLCKLLRPLQEKLIHQLKTKQVSLNYSTAELDAKLEDTQAQIDHLQRLTLQYRKDIEKAEELILDDIKFDQESLIDAIAVKAANDEDFSGDIQDFSDKVSSIFERRYRNLEIPTNAGSERLGSIIDNKLSPAISSINQTMDMVANLVTVVVSIYLIPGKTALDAAGAGAVLAQEASKSAMKAAAGKAALLAAKGAILKGMAFLVHVLGKLNPVEGIKDLAKMPVLKAMLKSKLNKITLSLLNHVFDNLRDELEVHILETYTRPIEQHNETLKNIKRDINAGFEDMDRLRESIKDDIQSLMTNDC
ncbi:MAG: hypothetical protein LRZ88_09230 [Candidatus Cloacimonetes bacterium]|nr:hypothetical protein [Candidatus Cloacimonadota bacterium]